MIIENSNFHLLKTAYDKLKTDIVIVGPRGVGKTFALKWLYFKLKKMEVPVVFIDLAHNQYEIPRSVVQSKIVIIDNGHKAIDGHTNVQYSSRKIVAFSPLGFQALENCHDTVYCG